MVVGGLATGGAREIAKRSKANMASNSKPSGGCVRKYEILDRFIPPRSLQTADVGASALSTEKEADGHLANGGTERRLLDKLLPNSRRRFYCRLLEDALLGGGAKDRVRVLPLWSRPPAGVQLCRPGGGAAEAGRAGGAQQQHWPVKARADPLLSVADPERSFYLPAVSPGEGWRRWRREQRFDWGASGALAVADADGGAVVLRRCCQPSSPEAGVLIDGEPELLEHFDDGTVPHALCWSPRPQQPLLLVTTNSYDVQMWNCTEKDLVASRRLPPGLVDSISWHPYKDVIALGSRRGLVHLLTAALAPLKQRRVFAHSGHGDCGGVSRVAFSPDGRLLACGGDAGVVALWAWESDELLCHLEMRSTPTSLSWHPWRSGLLAVGTLAGSIGVFQLPASSASSASASAATAAAATTASFQGEQGGGLLSVTAISFSPRTGELVAAFTGRGRSRVCVLAGLTSVVDRVASKYVSAVSALCWGPDATMLATVDASEKVCLWSFLGYETARQLRRQQQQLAQEAHQRRQGLGWQFGCVIR